MSDTPNKEEQQPDVQPTDVQPKPEETQEEANNRIANAKFKEMRLKTQELESKLAKYEEAQRLEEEAKLKEQGEYQKLLEQKEEEIKRFKEQSTLIEKKRQIQTKLLQSNIQPEMVELLEIKALELATTDETGSVNNLDEIVTQLATNYGSAFTDSKKVKPFNGNTPTSNQNNGQLTIEQIKSMPIADRPKNWVSLITQ